MRRILVLLLAGILASCATAVEKPEKRWEVKVKKQSDVRVWVSKPDGSLQCGEAPGLKPETAAQELRRAGVIVFSSRSGNDGLMRPAVCGAGTGNTVDLEIAEMDVPKALAQGYQRLSKQN